MEGKKRYVAIVLFLLIGLTLFTFANPVEEEKGSKGNGSKDPEVTDKDTVDGTLGTDEEQTQVQPQVQNQVADNSYANALAAVVKAEGSLETLDVEAARDLINRVTNQNQKDELTERLDVVEEAIDAIELVETLEKMVEEATDRDGILDSIDYRTDEEIIQKVDALRNEDVQESLKDRLQILSRILDDNTAPEYDGVEDNEITNKDVSLTYSDTDEETGTENEVTVKVTLDGEEIDYAETFTKEGTYVVTLTDEAFNETTVTFTIDKTAAKKNAVNANVNGYKNEVKEQYATNGNKVTAYISINEELKENPTFTFYTNGKKVAVVAKEDVVLSNSSNPDYPYVYTAVLNINESLVAEDGVITFTVTDIYDKAGNKTADITKMSVNGKVLTLDRTPNRVTFTSIKTTNDAVRENTYYVKNGDTVTLRIGFREKLGTNAVVKIGGREATLTYVKYFAQPNHHEYTATLTIPADETELAEGELSFTIENVTDEVGNKGFYYQTNGKTVLETITKNVTTNGKNVIYDRTAPTRKSTDFYVSGLTQVVKTFYTQYGKKVVVNITTDEELAEVPTFTLHNNGNDYAMNDAIYRGLNDKGYHLYQASFEVTEETGMTDGEITFTVSNIKDIAGNARENVTDATNGRLVVLDNQAPLVDKLALVGANGEWNKNKTEYKQYAKVGTTIYVNARFYEELAGTPVVTLNDKVTLTKATKRQSGNVWIYSYSYTVTAEDGLVDGPLQVKVTNCKDYAGNSVELTNANATMTSQKDIIIDKTAPTYVIYKDGLRPVQNVETVELNGKLYFSDNAEIQFHDNLRLSTMIVNDGKPYTTTVGVTGQIKYVREDGEYKYTVKDRAGNALTITVVRDTKGPEVTPSYETKTVEADKNGTFADFPTFEVKDEHNQPVSQELVSGEVNLGKLGEYELVYKFTDFLGNETTKTVKVIVVDTTAPVVTANLDENGNKDITLEAGIDSYKELGATVTDNLDEDRQLDKPSYINHYTLDGTYTGRVAAVDTTRIGKYLLVYVTEDANKNTSNNQLLQSKRWVIVQDTINPTLTVKDESVGTDPYYSAISFALSDSNLIDYVEVNGVKLERDNAKWSDANYQNIKEHLVAGKNTIVLYDTAGNKTEKTFYMDWTAPTVTAYNWLGDNPYRGADFKLSDNYAIDYVVINGVKFDRSNAKWGDANYVNVKNALVHGENTVVLYDAAGNSAEYKYNFDRKAPTITVKDSSVGTNSIYGELDLKLYDENEVSSVVINGIQLPHKGQYVDINDGDAYTFQHGTNTVVVTDKAGNVTTKTFNVTKFNLVVENGVANLTEDAVLIDKPFYNEIDTENEVTINGNGKTVTQYITSVDKMQWKGNHTTPNGLNIPLLANVFSSKAGQKVTIHNLTLTGTMNSVMFGNYEDASSNWFNTELNNVNITNVKVVSLSGGIAPAAVVYGKATLNNVNIYGTTRSELENSPSDPYWPIYDLAAVNSSNTTINGGKIGSIYLWAKAVMKISNAEVDVIDTLTTTGHLEIANGTTVNRINMNGNNSYNPDVTIKAGATVKTLDLTKVTNLTDIVIEDGATVETILTSGGEMTLDAWKAANGK